MKNDAWAYYPCSAFVVCRATGQNLTSAIARSETIHQGRAEPVGGTESQTPGVIAIADEPGGDEAVTLERLLIHAGGFNLGLVTRQVIGFGTPRGPQGRLPAVIAALLVVLVAVRRRVLTILASFRVAAGMRGWFPSATTMSTRQQRRRVPRAVSVGQTSGAWQRCRIRDSAREFPIREAQVWLEAKTTWASTLGAEISGASVGRLTSCHLVRLHDTSRRDAL